MNTPCNFFSRLAVVALLAVGCQSSEPPPEQVVAPRLAPPPSNERPLQRTDVAARGREGSPEQAIRSLDRHPFAFPLDRENLAWLEAQDLPPGVLDYLRKRALVDWESLRGDLPE